MTHNIYRVYTYIRGIPSKKKTNEKKQKIVNLGNELYL